MDWIIQHLITNKRNNYLIYVFLFSIIILDFFNDQMGFINEKYLIFDYSLCAIFLLIIKEVVNYWYKQLYFRNQKIISDIIEFFKRKNYDKVIEQGKLIKIIKPHLLAKSYWCGCAYLHLNNPEKALAELDLVESSYQNISDFFYHKGLALLNLGNIKKSIEYLTRSIELAKTWQNLDQRGVAYMRLEKLDEAEKDLKKSIQLKEDSSNTCNLGIVLSKKGQYQEAIVLYNRSIDIKPSNYKAFYNRALANYFIGDYENSIRDNSEVIELDKSRDWAYYNRALSKQKLNRLESAIADYDLAEKLGNEYNYLYFNRGFCKCEIGDVSDGLKDLIKSDKLSCKEAHDLIEKYNG